jgi:hypothetical protein
VAIYADFILTINSLALVMWDGLWLWKNQGGFSRAWCGSEPEGLDKYLNNIEGYIELDCKLYGKKENAATFLASSGEKRPSRNGTGYHPHFVEYQLMGQ